MTMEVRGEVPAAKTRSALKRLGRKLEVAVGSNRHTGKVLSDYQIA